MIDQLDEIDDAEVAMYKTRKRFSKVNVDLVFEDPTIPIPHRITAAIPDWCRLRS